MAIIEGLRAALYARFSTDKQRDTSTEDQLRVARAFAARSGWQVVCEHADNAISGSVPMDRRPGGKALLDSARAGAFDVLVVEGLDRISRELGDQERLVKYLEHRRIHIVGIADGYLSNTSTSKVVRITRGLINELYLDDLRKKTHRGLTGQFERGYHVGGTCVGYCSQPTQDGRGRELVVVESQAVIVRRIFAQYAAGTSARAIAHQLNDERIPSPRGGTWALSALVGDRSRGAGILNNELYVGRVVWNRRQWTKDPETGKRRYLDRPKSEWHIREVPALRIISDELWREVRARDERREKRPKGGAPLRTLFAGMLRCPACGGPMTAIDARRYGCNVHNDRGTGACAYGEAFRRTAVDDVLLGVVREELFSPDAAPDVLEAAREALADVAHERESAAVESRLESVGGEIQRLIDAIASFGMNKALEDRLRRSEREQTTLTKRLEQLRTHPAITPEEVVAAYQQKAEQLRALLDSDRDRDRTRELLAAMLGPVKLLRDESGEWAEMEEPAQRIALAGSSPSTLVARARFELATFGL